MRGMFPMAAALAAVAAFAQDVVQLAPDHAKVVFENDRVRVLHFDEPGHSKLPMHSHPDYVAVGFTGPAERGLLTVSAAERGSW